MGRLPSCPVPTVLHVLPHEGGGGERYVDLLANMPGFVHTRQSLSAGRSPLEAAWSIPTRWRRIARAASRYDVIHAHGDVTAAMLVPVSRRHASVWTTHGLSFLRRAGGAVRVVARSRVRSAIVAADRTICCSQVEREELRSLVGEALADRLVVVHNGVPVPPAVEPLPRERLRALPGDLLAIYIGRLDEWKDPLTALRAVRAARGEGAKVALAIAGDGPLLDALRLEAGDGISVLGFHEEPDRLLASADVLLMPSQREALSYSVLDGMARGLAIVSSDGLTLPEAVGDAGVVVGVGDVQAFANALRHLAEDPAERARLGAAARRRHAELFGIERFRAGIARVYEEALDNT
jgi:glycosyltransferase involved in cell wall biosynthesis